jgi:ketosteroid isomerase-like protein
VSAHDEIAAVLDEFHTAAAAADEDRYFATFAPGFVFLGTAPGERWHGDDFRHFVHGYFSRGQGWTYVPSHRSVAVSEDGRTAWFDETLDNEHYGVCRGSGVLRNDGERWRVQQYDLGIPVPDELAPELAARIRGQR